jgi:processive 1,2-diacylglycerol beta-glucosyltransferase
MNQDKYCPNCGKKYKWYETECPDCRVPLVEMPPEGAPSPDVTLVSVFQTTELGLLPLAEMALDQEEIEYFVRDAKGPLSAGGRTFRGDVPEMGIEVLVRTNDADRARELLADLEVEDHPETTPSPAPVTVSTPVPPSGNAVDVYDSASGAVIGQVSDEQLRWLDKHLERESSTDEDYYIDKLTLEMLQDAKGDPALIDLLRRALGDREGMDIRWARPESEEES